MLRGNASFAAGDAVKGILNLRKPGALVSVVAVEEISVGPEQERLKRKRSRLDRPAPLDPRLCKNTGACR